MVFGMYSGSKNRPDVWMFFTKVNNPTYLLTWALTCECTKESPYHRLSMGPRVKRTWIRSEEMTAISKPLLIWTVI
jgi:hypothetical protein